MKIYAERQTIEQYVALEPERLRQLENQQTYHLMMRNESANVEVVRASVRVENLQANLSRIAFGITYFDQDLHPANRRLHMAQLVDGYWSPDIPLPILGNGFDGQARTGFFVPYDLAMQDELDQIRVQLPPPLPEIYH